MTLAHLLHVAFSASSAISKPISRTVERDCGGSSSMYDLWYGNGHAI